MVWEYKVHPMHAAPFKGRVVMMQAELNELGKDGWELVELVHDKGDLIAFLKRVQRAS